MERPHSHNGRPSSQYGDVESNLSSLGHLGIVRSQRNALQSELIDERRAAAKQRQTASSLRKLALRLAVQISIKEAKINSHAQALARSRLSQYTHGRSLETSNADLLSSVHDYEWEIEKLFKKLDDESSGPPQDPKSSLRRRISFPVSPPPSPSLRKVSLRNQCRPTSSHSKTISPVEKLILCQKRVQALQSEYHKTLDTIARLGDSENALKDALGRQEEEHIASAHRLENEKREIESELDGLLRDCKNREQRIDELEESVRLANQSITEYGKELEHMNASKEDLETPLYQAQSKLASLSQSKDHLSQQLENERNKLQELQLSEKSLKEKVGECQDKIDALEANQSHLRQELSTAQSALATYAQTSSRLSRELATEKEQLARLQESELLLKTTVKEQEERNNSLEEAQAEHRQSELAFKATVKDLTEKNDALEASYARLMESELSLKTVIKDQEERTGVLEASQAKLLEAESSLKTAIAQYQIRNGALETAQGHLLEELEAAQKELSEYSESEGKLRQELESERCALGRLKEEYHQSQVQIATYERLLEKLEDEARNDITTVEDLRQVESELNADLRISKEQRVQLDAELREVTEANSLLEKRFEERNCSFELLQAEMTKIQHEKDTLARELEVIRSELTVAFESNEQSSIDAKTRIEELEERLRTSQSAIVVAEEREVDKLTEIKAILSSKNYYERQLEEMKIEFDRLGDMKQEFIKTVESLEHTKAKLMEDLESAKNELAATQSSNGELQVEIENLRESQSRLEQDLLSTTRKNELLEAELKTSNARLATARAQIEGLQADLDTSNSRLTTLVDDNQDVRHLNAKLYQELRMNQRVRASQEAALRSSRSRLRVSKATRRNVLARLEAAEAEVATLKQANAELEASHSEAQCNLLAAQSQLSENERKLEVLGIASKGQQALTEQEHAQLLQEADEAASARVSRVEELRKQFEVKLLASQEEVRDLKNTVSYWDSEVVRLRNDVGAAARKLRVSEDEIQELRTKLTDAGNENNRLKGNVTNLGEQRRVNRAIITEREEEIKKLRDHITEDNKRTKELEEQLELQISEVNSMRKINEQNISELARLRYLNDKNTTDHETSNTTLRAEINSLERSKELLTTIVQILHEKNEELQGKNSALQKLVASSSGPSVGESSPPCANETSGEIDQSLSKSDSLVHPLPPESSASVRDEKSQHDDDDDADPQPSHPLRCASIKPYRILGAEAAAGRHQSHTPEDEEVKRKLWELWEDQRKSVGPNTLVDGDGDRIRPATADWTRRFSRMLGTEEGVRPGTADAMVMLRGGEKKPRRKLQKRKTQELLFEMARRAEEAMVGEEKKEPEAPPVADKRKGGKKKAGEEKDRGKEKKWWRGFGRLKREVSTKPSRPGTAGW